MEGIFPFGVNIFSLKGDSKLKRIIAVLCILAVLAGCLCGCVATDTEKPTDTAEIVQE